MNYLKISLLISLFGLVFVGCGLRSQNSMQPESSSDISMSTNPLPAGQVEVVEYYNSSLNHYFITVDSQEQSLLDNGTMKGWARTGLSFNAYINPGTSLNEVCRFYGNLTHGGPDTHFFSADPSECDKLKYNPNFAPYWIFEKTAFHIALPNGGSCPSGSIAINRLYNQGMGGMANHRYVSSSYPNEIASMQSQGWLLEGPVFCAPNTPIVNPISSPPPVFTPPPPPPTSGNMCAGYPNVRIFQVPWGLPPGSALDKDGNGRLDPFEIGYFFANQVNVIEIIAPNDNKAHWFAVTGAEFQDPATARQATVSLNPCDFRPLDRSGRNGPMDISYGNAASVSMNPTVPGAKYYINIRNYSPHLPGGISCFASTCNMTLGFQWH